MVNSAIEVDSDIFARRDNMFQELFEMAKNCNYFAVIVAQANNYTSIQFVNDAITKFLIEHQDKGI